MDALTLRLLQMSLRGAVLILIAALLRFLLLRLLPKGMLRWLWLPAILALLLPLPSLFTLSLAPPAVPGEEESVMEAELERVDWDSWEAVPAAGRAVGVPEAGEEEKPGMANLLPLLWLSGLGLLGLGLFLLYLREYGRLRRALPLGGPGAKEWLKAHPAGRNLSLRVLPGLHSPLTYGVLRPVILLPREPDWESLPARLALEHEYVHVRHLDAAWKLLIHVLLALHWFNPAVWLLYALLGRDLELSCDEAVLRRYGREKREDFARMLIDLGRRGRPEPFPGLGAGLMRERVRAIMRYRRPGALRRSLAAALVLTLSLSALCSLQVGAVGERRYRSGEMTLSVPRELEGLLLVETPKPAGETAEILFRVWERETMEAGKELYPDSKKERGLLLTILCTDEATAGKYLRQLAPWDLLARDEEGRYYLVRKTTTEANMLTSRETEDQDSRWVRRKLVNAWVRDLRSHVSYRGKLRTCYPAYSSTITAYLAGTMYTRTRRYRISQGEDGPYNLSGNTAGDGFLARLAWETAAESARTAAVPPQGEPIVVSLPNRNRDLYFWPGSDLVLLRSSEAVRDDVRYWYKARLLDDAETVVGDLAAAWLAAVKAAEGENRAA